jgi:hypothetical protein
MITPSLPAGRFAVQGIDAKMQSNKVKALNSFARAVDERYGDFSPTTCCKVSSGLRSRIDIG